MFEATPESEAKRAGIIRKGTRFNPRTGNVVGDGWECVHTGRNYDTAAEALAAHHAEAKREHDELDTPEDNHWATLPANERRTWRSQYMNSAASDSDTYPSVAHYAYALVATAQLER